MNNNESIKYESFAVDRLEYPQYTRPAVWNGYAVPSVLLSGNHKEIASWQEEQAKKVTRDIRPDLWNARKD
jgi:tRNA (guanine37-N1)-methyltransferase